MKKIMFLKPVKEENIDNLSFLDYTIVYEEEDTKLVKIAIPDYKNQHLDKNNIEEAVKSHKVAFFTNECRNDIKNDKLIFLVEVDEDVVTSVHSQIYENFDITGMMVLEGKVLSKRLK